MAERLADALARTPLPATGPDASGGPAPHRRDHADVPAQPEGRVPPGAPVRVLVLAFEELMYAPLRLAETLADMMEGAEVRFSTTTRSPVLAVDDPGYAIRTRLVFPAHDDPADGPGERYAYNVAAGTDSDRRFDAVILVIDDQADTAELEKGLLVRLAGLGAVVLLAVVPSGRPLPSGAGPGDAVRAGEREVR
jgi:hypothetical protein